jgi:hypothetical protein
VCIEKALPTKKAFSFKAPEDGEYAFSIATVDQTGKATPADVSREAPCLIVVVDTQSPRIDLSLLPGAGVGAVVRCDVRDLNPDPTKLKIEYQSTDQSWHTLTPVSTAADLFPIPDEKSWTGLIRAETRDKANNAAAVESNLKTADTAATQSPGNPAPDPDKLNSLDNTLPSADSDPIPAHVESRSNKPAPADTTSTNRQLLNSTHAELAYQLDQVGPSGVGKVEVWMTSDEGKTWKKLCEDKNRKSPVEFDLPGEGVYGLTLVVSNGYGMGDPPPAKGDQPDAWIEVDTTKPVAQLLGVRPLMGDKGGALQITWSAKDKNLGADCIGLSFANSKEGPWMPIGKNLKNDGAYRWPVPRDAGAEFFVRLEVSDRAGNTTVCESPDKVVLDMSHPKDSALAGGSPLNRICHRLANRSLLHTTALAPGDTISVGRSSFRHCACIKAGFLTKSRISFHGLLDLGRAARGIRSDNAYRCLVGGASGDFLGPVGFRGLCEYCHVSGRLV